MVNDAEMTGPLDDSEAGEHPAERNVLAGANTPKPDAPSAPPVPGGALSPSDLIADDSAPAAPAPPQKTVEPPAAPPDVPAPPERSLQGDIETILQGTKLPERRGPAQAQGEPKKYDTSLGARASGDASGDAPAIVPSAPQQEAPVSAVHTFKRDLQSVVKEQKISLVRAAALEQEKKRPEPIEQAVKAPSRSPGIIVASLFLLLLGGGALAGVYYISLSGAVRPVEQVGESLVFTEASEKLPLENTTPSDIRRELSEVRVSAGGTLGAITRIVPTVPDSANSETGLTRRRAATFAEFMRALGAHPPDELLRALSDMFFTGIHTVDKNAPVIVVPIISYDHAFKGMLDWEKTLNGDLAPYFTPVPGLLTGSDGLVEVRTFEDVVMRNYDVRALKDDSDTIQLYYSFPTRNILIIAESPYSFPEVLSRLQADRRL